MTFREQLVRAGPQSKSAPVTPHDHDGADVSGDMSLANLKVNNLVGGTITGEEIIIAGGVDGIIRSDNFVTDTSGWQITGDGNAEFNSITLRGELTGNSNPLTIGGTGTLRSSNYSAGTAGWSIEGDGSAEFNDVLIRGDIESGNWDGTSPANLATMDSGATVGFYLDSSVGSAQFMGDVWVGGTIQIGEDADDWLQLRPTAGGVGLAGLDWHTAWAMYASSGASGLLTIEHSGNADGLQILTSDGSVNLMTDNVSRIKVTDTEISGPLLEWTSWTPTLEAITTDPTLGTGSSTSGRYIDIGDFVIAWGIVQFGSSGASAGSGEYLVGLPVTSNTDGSALAQIMGIVHLLDSGTNNVIGAATLHDSSRFRIYADNQANRVSNTVPWTWTNNDRIAFLIAYQKA